MSRRCQASSVPRGEPSGTGSIQFFGSALQVTPHFHSLLPDGVFVPREDGVRFEALPPPTQPSPFTWPLSRLYASSVSHPRARLPALSKICLWVQAPP